MAGPLKKEPFCGFQKTKSFILYKLAKLSEVIIKRDATPSSAKWERVIARVEKNKLNLGLIVTYGTSKHNKLYFLFKRGNKCLTEKKTEHSVVPKNDIL